MGGKIVLSKRMQAVADMVEDRSRVCDVGCDHGYISIYLVQSEKSPHVIAMDVKKGPLMRAQDHMRKYGVEDYITLRLSDGLAAYQTGEAQELICAGMGGRLMLRILKDFPEKTADFRSLILQPQSEIPFFRSELRSMGYGIVKEALIREEDKFYPVIKAVRISEDCRLAASQADHVMEDLLGPLIIRERPPELQQFIHREMRIKEQILNQLQVQKETEKNRQRKEELEEELYVLKRAERMLSRERKKD